jgi:DNA-binding transcriptional regulator/RsmH inhibitor MraZ
MKGAKPDEKVYLDHIVEAISSTIVRSKSFVDSLSTKQRKEYEKDELMKLLPIYTFNLSNVEVILKFIPEGTEQIDDQVRVVINTNLKDMATTNNTVSEIKINFTQKLLDYFEIDKQPILKEH